MNQKPHLSAVKTAIGALILVASAGATLSASAADRKLTLPLAAAMAANDAQGRLGTSVSFYFGSQSTPAIVDKLVSDKTSQKANAFGKADEKVCEWAFLSAMLSLQKRAHQLGANAVVNIESNYGNVPFSSETQYECHVGAIMGGVALKGDFVRIAEKK